MRTITVGPGAVPVERDDAGPADAFGHLVAQRPHLGGELGRRARLLEAELGMGVDVLVERVDVRVLGVEAAVDRGPGAGDIGGTGCTRQSQQGREGEAAPPEDFVALMCFSP